MAKWIKVLALMLCIMMVLPCAVGLAASVDDIIDEDADETASISDTLQQDGAEDLSDNLGTATPDAGAQPVGAAKLATGSVAPKFSALDQTQPASNDGSPVAIDMTKNCKFKLSEGKAGKMTDAKPATYWSNKKKAKITITLPIGDVAGSLFIEWVKKPASYTITEFNAAGAEVRKSDQSEYIGYVQVYPLDLETKKLEIVVPKETRIATIRLYSEGSLPVNVQDWQPQATKADLMVVAAHQDDEFLYFGGAIPYYNTVEGKTVQVVYMANCGRARYREALNGLWLAGLQNYPDFVGFPDKLTKKLKDAKKAWNSTKVLEALVARIRKYKPDVIVSHDPKGEYGHGAHMLVAEVLKDAVVQAADETKFKASADAYGVWQIQKLYLHSVTENEITMDWQTAYDELGNQTPSQVAKIGYSAHKSQQKDFKYEDGGKYDNSKFGLVYTMVGEDVDKHDFFENIIEDAARLNPAAVITNEPEQPDEDYFTGDAGMDEDDFLYGDEGLDGEDDSFDDALDEIAAPMMEPDYVEPQEQAEPVNRSGLIWALIGVPVLLAGSAFGTVYGRRYIKKRRKELRKAAKENNAA